MELHGARKMHTHPVFVHERRCATGNPADCESIGYPTGCEGRCAPVTSESLGRRALPDNYVAPYSCLRKKHADALSKNETDFF